ncbi:divergent PAP2 family protein [Candidatus Woesearchaeota archaeon]|nr:divergent PAP2 family protein [Candidatus Woesearchaeota archaeon]
MDIDPLAIHLFTAVMVAYLIAQTIKMGIWIYKEKRFSLSLILRRANMPSAHSATVAALTTGLIQAQGISVLSVTAFVFSIIVIRDALDVNLGIPKNSKKISDVRGYIHTPLEVCIGCLIGIVTACILV